jgi:cytochrome b561
LGAALKREKTMNGYPRYTLAHRLIHWAVAIIVIGILPVGLTLSLLGFDGLKNTFGLEVTNALYKYHKTFGVVVLGLMTLRLVLRLISGRPQYDPPLPRVNRVASSIVHWLLYIALLIMPVVGWAATAAGGYPVEFFNTTLPPLIAKNPALSETLYNIHGALGFVLLVLITIHVTSALMHWLAIRDSVIKRMSLF